ncbi:hypothetical protein [Streptomyces sp. NPDC046332]|uniref:hypothetical protein n=1 Tax=unclassified Streptomyces TaxID=2593676 RepID=UPI0033BFC1A1
MTSNDQTGLAARLSAAHRGLDGVHNATLDGEIDYEERDVLRGALLSEAAPCYRSSPP